jgi:hypothetical protein
MARTSYRLTESVAGFPEDEILDVTARFGDWHVYDLELQPRRPAGTSATKIVVSEADAGFSEAEILDETARIGDWHEYDLAFDPVSTDAVEQDAVAITKQDLERVAERVEPTA